MARRSTRSTRRKQSKRRSTRVRKMRGGGLKEDALKAIKDSGKTPEDIMRPLNHNETIDIGDFTFRYNQRWYNHALFAKKKGNNDSTYVEIYYLSEH